MSSVRIELVFHPILGAGSGRGLRPNQSEDVVGRAIQNSTLKSCSAEQSETV